MTTPAAVESAATTHAMAAIRTRDTTLAISAMTARATPANKAGHMMGSSVHNKLSSGGNSDGGAPTASIACAAGVGRLQFQR